MYSDNESTKSYLNRNRAGMKQMMTTCTNCGGLHLLDANTCRSSSRMPKRASVANRLRKTYKWRMKSEQIRQRDKYLCQVCLTAQFNTVQQYTYDNVSVHHIIPIAEGPSRGFDDDNLITVCDYHHRLAESGQIPRKVLIRLVADTPHP